MTCTTCRLIFFERELVSCKSKSALYVIHSFIRPDCVFCNVSAQHETCEREKESPLPSSCVSWGNMLPRSMVKIKECRECVFSICRPPPLSTSVSHSPQGFNYCLPSPLISTSRPLILNAHAHTDAQTHTQTQSGTPVSTQMEYSQVYTHTHTLLFLICSMLSSVNTVLQFPLVSVRATCAKGVSDKHHFPSIIHIHHFLSDSEHLTWNHRASRMIDGVNYRRLMFHFPSQGR